MPRFLACALAAVSLVSAAVPADQITSLPAFTNPSTGDGTPLSALYSGYLTIPGGKHHHYVYSASLSNPTTDPLIIWFNGGPGCSSLEGGFSESGLYRVQQFTDPPVLGINPFNWNNGTSNLFIESPAGVGFSYCDTPEGCQHTDDSTAVDNLNALLAFFKSYPELKSNDFWIAGESYAGIYIPMLAYAIYQNNLVNPSQYIDLKGVAVGNGCIGYEAGHCGSGGINDKNDIHGLVSDFLYEQIIAACDWNNESPTCSDLMNEAANGIGDIDIYYLYNTCQDPAITNLRAPVDRNSALGRAIEARRSRLPKPEALGLDPNCYGSTPALQGYFNTPAVIAAFHVAPAISFALCSNNGTFTYDRTMPDERTTIYPTLTQQAGYQVLVYNGEADLCVPFTDNDWWTQSMNYSQVSPWTAWMVPNGEEGPYVGGYRVHYDNNFTFATVRGAGHMVPETRGEASLAMITAHINGGIP